MGRFRVKDCYHLVPKFLILDNSKNGFLSLLQPQNKTKLPSPMTVNDPVTMRKVQRVSV